MASQKLTDYERWRLENIRRNEEMMASLKLQSIAAEVSASTRRPSVKAQTRSYVRRSNQIVARRSLRTRGLPPDTKGLGVDEIELMARTPKSLRPSKALPQKLLPMRQAYSGGDDEIELMARTPKSLRPPKALPQKLLPMREAYSGVSDRSLIETILGIAKKPHLQVADSVEGEFGRFWGCKDDNSSCGLIKKEGNIVESVWKLEPLTEGTDGITCGLIKKEKNEVESDLKLESLTLNPDNIARFEPGRIMSVSFFPCASSKMVVVGDEFGNVGFWHIDSKQEDDEESGIYLYHPHTGPISGISIQQHCMSKIFTSCYDGFIRLMDAEKEVFDLIYSTAETIYSLSQQSKDPKCLYFSEGVGILSIWDERTGKCSAQLSLHEERINTVNFNAENANLMATSSTDGTACIWDLRSINARKLQTLRTVSHKRSVHSAYFSPSGRSLVTTSIDNTVGISTGVNFEDISMIYHDNRRGMSNFRAIWGWDDEYVFIGNMKRGVDVISSVERRTVFTLRSPHMSAIPRRFDVHPYNVGMLAGATSWGQVYVWTLG